MRDRSSMEGMVPPSTPTQDASGCRRENFVTTNAHLCAHPTSQASPCILNHLDLGIPPGAVGRICWCGCSLSLRSDDCPDCGRPLGGSFPRCLDCQIVKALKGEA